jgi:hypothetical protein
LIVWALIAGQWLRAWDYKPVEYRQATGRAAWQPLQRRLNVSNILDERPLGPRVAGR